jgi:divalent metal cation (Fe/Co/Zn/Cd) transporter
MSVSHLDSRHCPSLRTGVGLVIGTALYNVLEAVVALWAGAEAGSIALLGFGLDSVIECAAAGVLLWRLLVEARGADERHVEETEHRAQRFIGVTFLVLAAYVVVQAGIALAGSRAPEESGVGIVLAGLSMVVMPLVSWAKLRVARRIGSAALRAEAKETLACSYLSLALLVGLVLYATAGWWWADPVAALLMVPWLVKEGLEGSRGRCGCDDKTPGVCGSDQD